MAISPPTHNLRGTLTIKYLFFRYLVYIQVYIFVTYILKTIKYHLLNINNVLYFFPNYLCRCSHKCSLFLKIEKYLLYALYLGLGLSKLTNGVYIYYLISTLYLYHITYINNNYLYLVGQ